MRKAPLLFPVFPPGKRCGSALAKRRRLTTAMGRGIVITLQCEMGRAGRGPEAST
jgi:hypothetical protein